MEYAEWPGRIIGRQVKELRNKSIPMVKVEWKEHYGTDATWEKEEEMRLRYPHLFPDEGLKGPLERFSTDLGHLYNGFSKRTSKKTHTKLIKGWPWSRIPFLYIEPQKYEYVLRKFFPKEKGPISNIDPIGNSPIIVGKEFLKKIAPTWMNVSLAMKWDPIADKEFGWVFEMYAYAVASALHNVGNILYKDFMIQPPWDTEIGNKFIIHFTYGCDYDMKGKLTYGKIGEWRFDKRSYTTAWPPKNLPLPPPGVPESVLLYTTYTIVDSKAKVRNNASFLGPSLL
ncbi:hypothetical protein HYC85_008984 [Camellia sinensis]|uniref:Hydroxyproline O-arabinosyltransferase-like domain-containing protein n=1 Tax=Camellia sinensis TaxID=4442 RepID=A0A7J7HW09_CAMSI|nr:hypothetical protein HYC85_008984 [Camellia sinensis]